jgi:hypothetical protein
MNARHVPEDDLELTATAVRLIRRASPESRAADIEREMAEELPGADPDKVRRCLGHAARLFG